MAPPAVVAKSCCQGESVSVARYASSAATGTRIKVCRVFQTRSKAGILSAKNSTANNAALTPITYQLESISRAGGNESTPRRAKSPSVATVAYRFNPAAKLVATSAATISFPANFIPLRIDASLGSKPSLSSRHVGSRRLRSQTPGGTRDKENEPTNQVLGLIFG